MRLNEFLIAMVWFISCVIEWVTSSRLLSVQTHSLAVINTIQDEDKLWIDCHIYSFVQSREPLLWQVFPHELQNKYNKNNSITCSK